MIHEPGRVDNRERWPDEPRTLHMYCPMTKSPYTSSPCTKPEETLLSLCPTHAGLGHGPRSNSNASPPAPPGCSKPIGLPPPEDDGTHLSAHDTRSVVKCLRDRLGVF